MAPDDLQATDPEDPKLKTILKAAFEAFRTYGFRRTSMEDIARGAGVSRSALYLHFRNKEDIFRSLARYFYDENCAAMAAELRPGRPVAETLPAALAAKDGQIIEAILQSPHGAEIMDTGFATSTDIATAGEARMATLLGAWLEAEARADRLRLPPVPSRQTAATILMAVKGLKQPGTSASDYARARAALAGLIADGMTVRAPERI